MRVHGGEEKKRRREEEKRSVLQKGTSLAVWEMARRKRKPGRPVSGELQ